MVRGGGPDLKRYMDKRLHLKLNGNREVRGVLRGYDQFMNIVLDEAVEVPSKAEERLIGMVVIRGNSVIRFEVLDPVQI
ncbi:small nuclear ribonucleoprotein polypeptide G [Tribonema minus]|uniref:Small nuclear ribonucleoprotein G n=1 Tax=Tribonema minus TaxID=303371 RepID=A0A835YWI2_9STRA|nr:small nuclear ribonucleoprotein polypeptide G [Tribonema minus]